ncbi:hypothetical protein Hamer_G027480, partial [Homarus americanus]
EGEEGYNSPQQACGRHGAQPPWQDYAHTPAMLSYCKPSTLSAGPAFTSPALGTPYTTHSHSTSHTPTTTQNRVSSRSRDMRERDVITGSDVAASSSSIQERRHHQSPPGLPPRLSHVTVTPSQCQRREGEGNSVGSSGSRSVVALPARPHGRISRYTVHWGTSRWAWPAHSRLEPHLTHLTLHDLSHTTHQASTNT